ncbi:MAG: FAD:protein FMN transferase, partial [Candidatus Omnitrophota bacterium]
IDIGGQIYALGRKFNKPWRVAIRNPRGGYFIDYLGLTDQCVATSGDYEQYFIKKGKRYAHIIDPRTGYPAQTEIASVTVVAQEGLIADALATAVFVLGKEKGRELVAEKFPGVELEIVDAEY